VDEDNIISEYTLSLAIADGVLVEICKDRWGKLTGGKPLVATSHIYGEISLAGLMEIWNEYVDWKKRIEPTLPEENRLFTTSMNDNKVWLIEDGQAYTILYPEDY
jgi:hypothetical protein